MEYVLGVDLGATNLRVAIGDREGTIVARAEEPVAGAQPAAAPGATRRAEPAPSPLTGAQFAARVAALAHGVAAHAGVTWARVRGAAVGVPGVPAGDGFEGLIAGAAGLAGAPLRALLGEALGMPVALENDLNLAAVAEHRRRGVADLAFIGVGTGVGMGVVVDGRLLRGAAGAAGELGHLPFGTDVVAGPDGLGPLEAVAGGAGLAARWGGPAREVFAAADRGDREAVALLEDQASSLAVGIRAVQALLDPGLIVLGGGIGVRPDLVERVRRVLAGQGQPAPVVEASVLGEDAGLVGALLVAPRRGQRTSGL